jgi:hypothetical protein
MSSNCYYCGEPATSTEHVPPAYLFPEQKDLPAGVDYRNKLITVPSCDNHNSQKSKDDEYLVLVLVHGYLTNQAARDHFDKKVVRALIRRPARLHALYADQTPVTVDGKPTKAVTIDRDRFDKSIEHVCQGLHFHHFGKRWTSTIEIYSQMFLSEADWANKQIVDLCKQVAFTLSHCTKHGENPDIFWYQMLVDVPKQRFLCRMMFYGGFDVFCVSDPELGSERTGSNASSP